MHTRNGMIDMKIVKYERVITECTECMYRIILPYQIDPDIPKNLCDLVENPEKSTYARPIPDVSNIPEWCPLEDI